LRDLRYLGDVCHEEDGKMKLPLYVDHGVLKAYNKMHARFRVQMEWGMGNWWI